MAEQEDESVITEVEDKLRDTMKAKLHHLDFAREKGEPHTIYRVLPSIRDKHREDYDPKIIFFDPLHAKSERLEPMESLKCSYL